MEEWKEVPGSNGHIEVSNLGRVRQYRRGVFVVARQEQIGQLCRHRYYRVNLKPIGRRRVHRLVVEAFIGPVAKGFEIDHIDGDSLNNRLENLRVVSRRENHQNRRPCSNTGHKSVHLNKYGKYQVYVDHKYIGTYLTLEEAVMSANAARVMAGYFKPIESHHV